MESTVPKVQERKKVRQMTSKVRVAETEAENFSATPGYEPVVSVGEYSTLTPPPPLPTQLNVI